MLTQSSTLLPRVPFHERAAQGSTLTSAQIVRDFGGHEGVVYAMNIAFVLAVAWQPSDSSGCQFGLAALSCGRSFGSCAGSRGT